MSQILPASSFPDLHLAHVDKSQGRYLPRWEAHGAIYHLALHLADSVPQTQLDLWQEERTRLTSLACEAKRPLTADERAGLKSLYDEHIEKYLAAGHGECLLRNAEAATALADMLNHDNGRKYALHLWCIMPNHAHIIVGGFADGYTMGKAVADWKRISGHRINRLLGHNGPVWHRDGYSRIIRDAEEYRNQLKYVWYNPESAALTAGFRRERYVACP